MGLRGAVKKMDKLSKEEKEFSKVLLKGAIENAERWNVEIPKFSTSDSDDTKCKVINALLKSFAQKVNTKHALDLKENS